MQATDLILISVDDHLVEPTAFDEMRRGCYDVHERIKDMSAAADGSRVPELPQRFLGPVLDSGVLASRATA